MSDVFPFWKASSLLVGFFGLCGLGACDFGEGDAKIPGDSLGTFHVVARLDESTCGAGALGSEDVWEFDVQVSKDGAQVFWLNGEDPVAGTLAADEVTFSFDSSGQVQLIEPRPGFAGCSVIRTDRASGAFDSQEEVLGFAGRLSYSFVPTADSDCTEAIGVEGGFHSLPCEIRYAMTATRTSAPEE